MGKIGQKETWMDKGDKIGEKSLRGIDKYGGKVAGALALAGAGVAATGVGLPVAAGLEVAAGVVGGVTKAAGWAIQGAEAWNKAFEDEKPAPKKVAYRGPQYHNENIVQSQARAKRLTRGYRKGGRKFR